MAQKCINIDEYVRDNGEKVKPHKRCYTVSVTKEQDKNVKSIVDKLKAPRKPKLAPDHDKKVKFIVDKLMAPRKQESTGEGNLNQPSNISTNDSVITFNPYDRKRSQTYETQKGEKIQYNSVGESTDSPSQSDVQREGGYSPKVTNDGVTWAERVLTEKKGVSLFGPAKIDNTGGRVKNPRDVAFLFRHLQDAATENVFVALTRDDGSYEVLYIGTGGTSSSVVDTKLIYPAAIEFGATGLTFVHNHPSGSLTRSEADARIHTQLKNIFEGTGIKVNDSVIINLDSGKYATFRGLETNSEIDEQPQTPSDDQIEGSQIKLKEAKVYEFGRQKLHAPSSTRPLIVSSDGVAAFLSQQKSGSLPKIGIIVLDRQSNVTRYVMEGDLTDIELKKKVLESVGRHGDSVILVTNGKFKKETVTKLKSDIGTSFSIADAIEVTDSDAILNSLKSFRDEGLLVNEPATEKKEGSNIFCTNIDAFTRKDGTQVEAHERCYDLSRLDIGKASVLEKGDKDTDDFEDIIDNFGEPISMGAYRAIPNKKSTSKKLSKTGASINVSPLYNTKVKNVDEAEMVYDTPFYQKYLTEARNLSRAFGVTILSEQNAVGGFGGSSEVSTVFNVSGDFDDITNFSALLGATAPEVQISTIAATIVESGSETHNADVWHVAVKDEGIAMKAAREAGFEESGYTLADNKITFINVFDFDDSEIDNRITKFGENYEEFGGEKLTGKDISYNALQSEYIDFDRRGELMGSMLESSRGYGQNWDGFSDVIQKAQGRNEAFKKWQEIDKSPVAEEYRTLRHKQIDFGEKGAEFPEADRLRLKSLEDEITPTLSALVANDEAMYLHAKQEIEHISDDITRLAISGFNSKFGIKRPARAAVKLARWYSLDPNQLGDGARTNIIVENDGDADFLYEQINTRFGDAQTKESLITDLGYPKRLVVVRTSNGKLAEFQVMTKAGYLAKDGIRHFPDDQKKQAEERLKDIRAKVGFDIPDGVGHWFYEINRDTNVPKPLRDESARLSNIYYKAMTGVSNTAIPDIAEKSFRSEMGAFLETVQKADKSRWDSGNEARVPESLSEFLKRKNKTV